VKIFRACGCLLLLFVLASPAFAGIRPSFALDYSSWHATHILLVVTTHTDGTFEVIESWKGDLNVGEQVVVPELRPDRKAIPISRYPQSWSDAIAGGIGEMIPRQPAGSRMVLFLESATLPPTDRADNQQRLPWKPADIFGEMKTSVLWIDGGQIYGFLQLMNPGPSVLFEFSDSEGKVRDRVTEIDGVQKELTASLEEHDGAQRAERLKQYTQSDIFPARSLSLEELGKSGPAAVPTIRGMLDDPAFADEAAALVQALVAAGGDAVGEELNSRLRQDLAFWRAAGPTLPQGWWNQELSPHAPLRGRYSQTEQLIMGLEKTHYAGALKTAIELRDFWRSLPQLNDPSGINRMAGACDMLISHLQTN
jgi:hypothetical protein